MNNTVEDKRTAALDGVNIAALHKLRDDARIWTLADIERELELSKGVLRALWRTACNYIYGGHREWPPRGQVFKVRLPDVGQPVTDLWWPPDPTVFPPPDVSADRSQPRWRAGTILMWAVQVGRLTMVDLLPTRVTGRGFNQHRHTTPPPDISGISLAKLHEMIAADELWTAADIADFLGATQESTRRWEHATRNRWEGGVNTWPPSRAESLRQPVEPTGAGLDWWPSHYRLLPPPDSTADGYRWRAGTVVKWLLETGRMLPDGTKPGTRAH